jgi:hypothetical protein
MIVPATASEMIPESSWLYYRGYDICHENNTTTIWVGEKDIVWLDPAPEGTVYLVWSRSPS